MTTKVKNGVVISSDNPNTKVGSAYDVNGVGGKTASTSSSSSKPYKGIDGNYYLDGKKVANPNPISGVSSNVSSAVYSSGLYNPDTPVDNSKISGSSSVLQNQNLTSSLNNASTSLTSKPPTTYTPLGANAAPIFGSSGPAIATLQAQLNEKNKGIAGYTPLKVDGKYGPQTQAATQFTGGGAAGGASSAGGGATTDQTTGNTTFPNGLVVDKSGNPVSAGKNPDHTTPPTPVNVTSDSSGGSRTTYSDGSTSYTPPSPALASLHNEYNTAVSQETTAYHDLVSQQNATYQQQLSEYKEQMQQAKDAAEANYDTNNPEGAGSDKSEFMSSVTKPFTEAINNLNQNHSLEMKQLGDSHSANLQNLSTQLQTGIATNQANMQSAGKDSYNEWAKGLAGDGDDDATVGAQALMAQNSGNPSFTWDMALSQANSAINKQTIATDKTLSAEDRANATAASSDFFRAIGQITTPFEQLPDATKMSLIQQAIDAKLAPDAKSAYQLVSSMNKTSVNASLMQQKEIDAQNRLAIAAERASTSDNKASLSDIQTFFKNSLASNPNAFTEVQGMDTVGQNGWIADTAHALQADPSQVALALKFMGVKLTPDTVRITSKPSFGNLFGLLPNKTTTTTSKNGSSGGSSSNNNPLGI